MRRVHAWALLVLVALLGSFAQVSAQTQASSGQDDDPISARAFEVHYRPLIDAADVVDSLLSSDGTVLLKPRLKILVVEDRESVLSRVESVLRSFDLPPRNVEVTVNLIRGTRRPPEEDAAALSKRSVIDLPQLDIPSYGDYRSLGSRSINGLEGRQVSTDLTGEYRLIFEVEDVDEKRKTVRFKLIALQLVQAGADGQEQTRNLYSMAAVVDTRKTMVFGAARDPDADTALFLTLQAKLR